VNSAADAGFPLPNPPEPELFRLILPMNNFDTGIVRFLNEFSQQSPVFDHVVAYLGDSNLLKGGIIVALLWMLWLRPGDDIEQRRRTILRTLTGCAVAILVARGLAVLLPFRSRPLHDDNLSFALPLGFDPRALEGWSSFPSDHAALFFGLAAGIFSLSKKIGWFILLHAILIVSLPRLYLGIHYPTDIVVGAIIGWFCVWLANRLSPTDWFAGYCLGVLNKHPSFFYICFYLITFQIAVLFDDVRGLGHLIVDTAKYLFEGGEF